MPQLICQSCGRPLTGVCTWGEASDRNLSAPDGQSPVPPGVMVRLTEEDAVTVHGPGHFLGSHLYSPALSISVNPVDVIQGATVSAGRDNGCCGSDGMDGPNRACRCGAIVGTEWSDCWTLAEFRFHPSAVRVST